MTYLYSFLIKISIITLHLLYLKFNIKLKIENVLFYAGKFGYFKFQSNCKDLYDINLNSKLFLEKIKTIRELNVN